MKEKIYVNYFENILKEIKDVKGAGMQRACIIRALHKCYTDLNNVANNNRDRFTFKIIKSKLW